MLGWSGEGGEGGGRVGGGGSKVVESEDYVMFRDLMKIFNEERNKMEAKYK